MYILGDIGNTETKIFLVSFKDKILKKIIFPSKELNQRKLNKFFQTSKINYTKIQKVLFCSVVPKSFNLIKKYLSNKKLSAEIIGRGGAWLDTGSIEDFYKTSNFVSSVENRQGFKIACLEEIALNNNWIKKKDVLNAIKFYGNCDYSKYLKNLISR